MQNKGGLAVNDPPDPSTTILFPGEVADLFYEVNELPQKELDAVSPELPAICEGDIIKDKLGAFAQKTVALGWRKIRAADAAEKAGQNDVARQLYTEADLLYAIVNMVLVSSLNPHEICDDSLVWKVCRGYVLVGRVAPAASTDENELEVEFEEDDDSDDDVDKVPEYRPVDKKKLH